MKNWLAVAMATVCASAIIVTNVDCAKAKEIPADIEHAISAHSPPAAPKPNDKVHKASRLPIKRATDVAAASASLAKAQKTTVEAMLTLARPDGLAGDLSTPEFQNRRVGPFETTIWKVDATITEVILRPDGDYYLVIEGDKGGKTVVEVPDPKLCQDSKKLAEITAVRKALESKFHPTGQPQKVNVKATFTGFGFFGYAKAKEGKPAGNGARIMPGLKVDWR